MQISEIGISNFRCYRKLELDLHENMTILVANNGQGKTAILDAIRIGISPFVSGFDLAAQGLGTIDVDDIYILRSGKDVARQLPSILSFKGKVVEKALEWKCSRESEAGRAKTRMDDGGKRLKDLAKSLQEEVRNIGTIAEPIDLPVFGYYGSGRLWKEKRLTSTSKAKEIDRKTRTFAYRDCLEPASSYKHFSEWYIDAFKKMREQQIKQIEAGKTDLKVDPFIQSPLVVVQKSVNKLLMEETGWYNPSYEIDGNSIVLQHSEKAPLKVDQLSDGIKNMLAMVADISYRCSLLNPHYREMAAEMSPGIVLIDEVGMHLHPRWQQTLISSLTKAFPKIQFVVSTHSPQVLSTVPSEMIRVITHSCDQESNIKHSNAQIPDLQSQGTSSASILSSLMGVDPIPNVEA